MPKKNTADKDCQITERIIRAATLEFAEKGFGGARVDEIAKLADVNKSTLYYQIGDKVALYEEVLKVVMTRLADEIYRNHKKKVSPEEKLKQHIMTVAKSIGPDTTFSQIMLREIASGGANLTDETLKEIGRIIGYTVAVLKEGRSKKAFGQANDFMVHMMIMGSLLLYTAGEPIRKRICVCNPDVPTAPTKQAAKDMADILVKALRPSGLNER